MVATGLFEAKGLHLKGEFSAPLPMVFCDETGIKQPDN
jgi:hypothetical protein